MTYTADQAATVQSAVDAVREKLSTYAEEFFLFYIKKFPGDMDKFPNYKGKAADSLPSVPEFAAHVAAVVGEILNLFEAAKDDAALQERAKAQIKSHKPRDVGTKEFENMLGALSKFMKQKNLGSFNAEAWDNASGMVLAALK